MGLDQTEEILTLKIEIMRMIRRIKSLEEENWAKVKRLESLEKEGERKRTE